MIYVRAGGASHSASIKMILATEGGNVLERVLGAGSAKVGDFTNARVAR